MQLGERLKTIAAFVPKGARVVDVGTDHAYLPIYLVKEGTICFAIAADISEGPLAAAKNSIEAAGMEKIICTRKGDGLTVVEPDEADTITIAGMGGSTIAKILLQSTAVLEQASCLVLQPMGEAAVLRKFLYEHGWYIEDEALASEAGHVYKVLFAKQGNKSLPNAFELEVGPILLQKKPLHFKEHMLNIIAKNKYICDNMEKSSIAVNSEKYLRTRELLTQAKELLSCL